MTKPNIADLVEKTVALKRDSEVDLLNVDPTVLPGRTALRNSALQQYLEHLAALKQAIGSHAGGIFVYGPGSEAFAKLAVEEGPAIVLDASEVYRKVAEAWFPTVRVDKVFALDCVMSFLGGLHQMLSPLGIREVARPDFGKYFGRPVENLADAIGVTRDILRATLGDDLNGLWLNHRLAEEVVKAEWDLTIIPAVILNSTAEEVTDPEGLLAGLFYGHSVVVEVKETEVEKKFVLGAFKLMRHAMNPKSKTDTTETTDPTATPSA